VEKTFDTINPTTGKLLAQVQEGDKEDIDKAVKAARAAPSWANFDPSKRSQLMYKFSNTIEANINELALIELLDNGKPLDMSKGDISMSIDILRYYAGWCDKIHGKTIPGDGDVFNMTIHEALGVVGCIIPWNFPSLLFIAKIAPALATGNTIVVKPAETTPC
jgi:aldehyde dehydrogenase (NAD+)